MGEKIQPFHGCGLSTANCYFCFLSLRSNSKLGPVLPRATHRELVTYMFINLDELKAVTANPSVFPTKYGMDH
ncbi:MAG: hypothetical protein OHK0029_35210 [Armatimonadaceae bacterium]